MINKNDKILILGSSGLIGRAFLKVFTNHGYYKLLTPTRSELNLEQSDSVNEYFKNSLPNLVILAAGKVGGILENNLKPADFITKNLLIQLNTIQAAQLVNCKKTVLLGSSCMYPKEAQQPLKESYLGTGLLEQTSLAYSISKIAGLQLGFSYNKQYNSDRYLCVLPNSAYGPGDNFDPNTGHVLSSLINKFHHAKLRNSPFVELWGSGRPRREFIFSDDIADAVLFLLKNDEKTKLEPINIGSGYDVTINELAQMIANTVGYRGSIKWDKNKPDGAMRKLLDTTKLNSMGWKPLYDLKDGIQASYSWYVNSIG